MTPFIDPFYPAEEEFERSKDMKKIQEHVTSRINFLAEQDGVPERALKSELIAILDRTRSVQRAYLVLVEYPEEKRRGVALCLAMELELDVKLVQTLGSAFSKMFGSHECLDIFRVSKVQEDEIRYVCKSFYPVAR